MGAVAWEKSVGMWKTRYFGPKQRVASFLSNLFTMPYNRAAPFLSLQEAFGTPGCSLRLAFLLGR